MNSESDYLATIIFALIIGLCLATLVRLIFESTQYLRTYAMSVFMSANKHVNPATKQLFQGDSLR